MSLIACLTAISCAEGRLGRFITSLNIFNHNLSGKSHWCFGALDATSDIEVFTYQMDQMKKHGKQCAM